MINSVKYDFLKSVEADFHALNENYEKLSSAFKLLKISDGSIDSNVFFRIGIPEIGILTDKMVDWHISREKRIKGELENEIEYNLVNNHTGYLVYARNVFLKQYNYLGENYPYWLKRYIENENIVNEHAECLSNDGGGIAIQDFYDLFKIRTIQLFRWVEREYALAYQSYDPIIRLDRELPLLPWFYIEPISLNYGRHNQEVMEFIYSKLSGIYFNMPAEEFYAHFSDRVPRQPIKWGGKLMTLLPLFMGQEVPINDQFDFEIVKIKINNPIPQMISDHFADPYGNPFKKTSVSTLISPQAIRSEGNYSSPITKLLKTIHLRFHK